LVGHVLTLSAQQSLAADGTALPVTAIGRGLAKYAMSSATSTGSPPWKSELSLRPVLPGGERNRLGHLGLG